MTSNIAEERKKLKAREAKNAEDAKKPVHKVRNFFWERKKEEAKKNPIKKALNSIFRISRDRIWIILFH